MTSIEEKYKQLPPELQREVMDFIEFLLSKKQKKQEDKKLTLDWVGGLKKYKDKYSSLELEKKSMEWRD